jgi:hypothetical protein
MLEVFDADQLLAMQRGDKGQARVEAAITQLLVVCAVDLQFADHHGARATVATGAAFFGAGLSQMLTEVIKHRQIRVQAVLGSQFLIE